jgi:hypothetical protein
MRGRKKPRCNATILLTSDIRYYTVKNNKHTCDLKEHSAALERVKSN